MHADDFCAVMLHRLPLTRELKSARRMLLSWKPLKRWVPVFAWRVCVVCQPTLAYPPMCVPCQELHNHLAAAEESKALITQLQQQYDADVCRLFAGRVNSLPCPMSG